MSHDEFINLPEKISLVSYPYIRYMIREMRKENRNNYTAEELSIEIGKSKSWLAQIENGRLNSIIKSDLFSIVSKLSSPLLYEDIEAETISAMEFYECEYQNNLNYQLYEEEGKLPLTEDTLIKRDLVKILFEIKNTIFKNYNNLTIDEKKKLLDSLNVLNKNINNNINLTYSLLVLPIHAINSNHNMDIKLMNEKKFVTEINTAFTNYLSSSLNS